MGSQMKDRSSGSLYLVFVCGVAAACGLGTSCRADASDALAPLLGASDCVAVVGNGGLTVGLNSFGRLVSCRWPSPGYHDQLRYRTASGGSPTDGAPPDHGAMWAVRWGGQTHWLTGPPWLVRPQVSPGGSPFLRTTCELPDGGVTVDQVCFVHPELDVLVTRIDVAGTPEEPGLFWYANFSPCTRLVPELPVADWALDTLNDFACFVTNGGEAVVHFRVAGASAYDHAHAHRLALAQTRRSGPYDPGPAFNRPDWLDFREGTWIAYAGPAGLEAFQCGNEQTEASAFEGVNQGRLSAQGAAAGQCNSAARLRGTRTETGWTTYAVVAFGHDPGEALGLLQTALERGYPVLRQETEAYWEQWLPLVPAGQHPAILAVEQQCLMAIARATDRQTAAISRAPITQPPLYLDWPRHGIWMTMALDRAGKASLAEAHLRFYANAIRRGTERGKPAGSMPAALYSDGQEGLPHLILDLEATAWLLYGIHMHATALPGDHRAAFLSEMGETVDLCTDFLAGWRDDEGPLHSFDPILLRDTRRSDLLLAVRTGVQHGLLLACERQEERPGWQDCLDSLDLLIQHRYFDAQGDWTYRTAFPLWPTALLPEDDPRWDAIAQQQMDLAANLDGPERLRLLCGVAQIQGKQEPTMDRLRDLLRGTIAGRPPLGSPDALEAACLYLAIREAFPH